MDDASQKAAGQAMQRRATRYRTPRLLAARTGTAATMAVGWASPCKMSVSTNHLQFTFLRPTN